ncbi:MAG: SAV_2336 N-terminal domain-related protein, partial [Chloroflexota bacterium]
MTDLPNDPNLDGLVDPQALADYIWLTTLLGPLKSHPHPEQRSIQQEDLPIPDYPANPFEQAPSIRNKRFDDDPDSELTDHTNNRVQEIHTDAPPSEKKEVEDWPESRTPINIPAANALPHQLKIGNSLRPLMQRIDSRFRLVLDEQATADLTAKYYLKKSYIPQFRPKQERWFELCFVVDTTPSMQMWRATAIELGRLLAGSGAFHIIYTYRLNLSSSENKSIELRSGLSSKGRRCNLNEIKSFSGRRIVLILSDCTHRIWYNGEMQKILEGWGKTVPTTIVQPLPFSQWSSTALYYSDFSYVYTQAPATPNLHLQKDLVDTWFEADILPSSIPIPVFSLSP